MQTSEKLFMSEITLFNAMSSGAFVHLCLVTEVLLLFISDVLSRGWELDRFING
jgi:hypothetical protein